MQAGGNADIRQDIADVLKENALGRDQFIGLSLMPLFSSQVKNGTFQKIAFATVKTKVSTERAPGSNYNRVEHATTYDTFDCVEHGLEEPVDDGQALVLGNYFDAEVMAADLCEYYLMLKQEHRISTILMNTTTFTAYKTAVTTPWSTAATCTPVKDVETAKQSLIDQVNGMVDGVELVLAMNRATRLLLTNSTDIKNRALYDAKSTRQLSDQELAATLGVDRIAYSRLSYNGTQIWPTNRIGLYYVSSASKIQAAPHVGRTMLWTADCPENAYVESYREEAKRSNIVRVRQYVDEKLLTARAGHLLTSITA